MVVGHNIEWRPGVLKVVDISLTKSIFPVVIVALYRRLGQGEMDQPGN